MNSFGNVVCVEIDLYFLLGISMIFDIERVCKINICVGKWWIFFYFEFWEGWGWWSLIWFFFEFLVNYIFV